MQHISRYIRICREVTGHKTGETRKPVGSFACMIVLTSRLLDFQQSFLFVNKSFEQPDDKYSIFMWLRKNAGIFSKSVLHTRFTKQQIKTLVRENFFLFCHPEYRERIYKKRFDDGRREIYVLGKKIFSYRKKK